MPVTYDRRGNLTSDGTWTYTYNAAGRMVRAESLAATQVYTPWCPKPALSATICSKRQRAV